MAFRQIATAFILLLFGFSGAFAQSFEGAFSGDGPRIYGTTSTTEGAEFDISWQAEARLGTLLGEPVVSLRFKYDIAAGIVTIPQLTLNGRRYTTIRYGQLPPKLQAGIRLIDVKLRMTFSDGMKLMDVVADVGATGGPGEWSFNVPGSPDWDALFYSHSSFFEFLDEETARAAMGEELTLVNATIEDATLSLYQLHDDYMRLYDDREEYRIMGTAFERLIEGLKRSYDIDASNIKDGWTDAYFYAERAAPLDSNEEWWERRGRLSDVFEKLANLPEELRTGTNHGPYEQAVEELRLLSIAATDGTYNYVPDGVDPDSFPEGHEPEFDSETIDERLEAAGAQRGVFSVSLVWDSTSDLDLYVHCPGGGVINYENKSACGGRLDVDANAGDTVTISPVENIYWEHATGEGNFTVQVKMHKRGRGNPEWERFLLQIRDGDRDRIFEGEVREGADWRTEF